MKEKNACDKNKKKGVVPNISLKRIDSVHWVAP